MSIKEKCIRPGLSEFADRVLTPRLDNYARRIREIPVGDGVQIDSSISRRFLSELERLEHHYNVVNSVLDLHPRLP